MRLPENLTRCNMYLEDFLVLLWSGGGTLPKIINSIFSSQETRSLVFSVLDACFLSHHLLCYQQFTTFSISLR